MALEDLILLHTEALTQNTEAVKSLTAALAGRATTKIPKEDVGIVSDLLAAGRVKDKVVKEESKNVVQESTNTTESVPFITVRELVLKLSKQHRDAIVAINAKYKIARLGDLLENERDLTSDVKDQAKLEAIYADLLALEE